MWRTGGHVTTWETAGCWMTLSNKLMRWCFNTEVAMITCQGELSLENDVWCSPPQLLHNPMKLLQFLKRQEKKESRDIRNQVLFIVRGDQSSLTEYKGRFIIKKNWLPMRGSGKFYCEKTKILRKTNPPSPGDRSLGREGSLCLLINTSTPEISLVILLTVCCTILLMLVRRICYWNNYNSLNRYLPLSSSLVCLILYWSCMEKFFLGHSWESKS